MDAMGPWLGVRKLEMVSKAVYDFLGLVVSVQGWVQFVLGWFKRSQELKYLLVTFAAWNPTYTQIGALFLSLIP